MPQPDDESQEALDSLQTRLDALTAERKPSGQSDRADQGGLSAGYRLLGEVIGGVFGGLGVGLAVDHFANTTPFGVIVGLLLGIAASGYATTRFAAKADKPARKDGA
jgi:ATP synthase protein I